MKMAAPTKPAKPVHRPAGKPATATKPATAKPAAAKPATVTEQAAPQFALSPEEILALSAEDAKALTAEDRATMSDAQKEALKEVKKRHAFAALKERAQAKRAARVEQVADDLKQTRKDLKKGQQVYSTRASYYGCLCEITDIQEVRGRILVTVKVLTSKGGKPLEDGVEKIRRMDPRFLQEEAPTEKYVQRRPTEAHADAEGEEPEEEAEVDETEEEPEDEEEVDEEAEAENEATDETEDESGDEDEADEDSWG
jgi:hypothetical protein